MGRRQNSPTTPYAHGQQRSDTWEEDGQHTPTAENDSLTNYQGGGGGVDGWACNWWSHYIVDKCGNITIGGCCEKVQLNLNNLSHQGKQKLSGVEYYYDRAKQKKLLLLHVSWDFTALFNCCHLVRILLKSSTFLSYYCHIEHPIWLFTKNNNVHFQSQMKALPLLALNFFSDSTPGNYFYTKMSYKQAGPWEVINLAINLNMCLLSVVQISRITKTFRSFSPFCILQ